MSTAWLMQVLALGAQEPCYDEIHVFTLWFRNPSLPFDTVFRVCGICGHPETWMWVEDA